MLLLLLLLVMMLCSCCTMTGGRLCHSGSTSPILLHLLFV